MCKPSLIAAVLWVAVLTLAGVQGRALRDQPASASLQVGAEVRDGDDLIAQRRQPESRDSPGRFSPERFRGGRFGPERFGPERFGPERFGGGPARTPANRSDYPTWQNDPQFTDDVFTFARVRYTSTGYARRGRAWDNDYPDCDWNFSVRLHQLTSMKVDPDGVVIDLTDPSLPDYPFIYLSNIGNMMLSSSESEALNRYLLNGGFMMADDFWAPEAWLHVKEQMRQVLPGREPVELQRDHEIFHIVYQLKTKPQVPSIRAWQQGYTFEYWHGDPRGDEGPHFWGYFDDSERLMALMCHNNDIGDGWEREGENEQYFHDYSVRVSYPLGINIVTYAMTH